MLLSYFLSTNSFILFNESSLIHDVSYFIFSVLLVLLLSFLFILLLIFSNIFLSLSIFIFGIININNVTNNIINIGDKIYGKLDSFSTTSSFIFIIHKLSYFLSFLQIDMIDTIIPIKFNPTLTPSKKPDIKSFIL